MTGDKDWRLTNQEQYLMGVTLIRRHYQPIAPNDHDHCEFCWAKFMMQDYPDVLHDGYATLDNYRWICEPCFQDFRGMFRWHIIDDATQQT